MISYDHDLYSDGAIAAPNEHYRALRELGGAVWLPRHEMWAISRFEDVRRVLLDHGTFSSASGIAANADMNSGPIGNTVTSDPPAHTKMRSVVRRPLAAPALQKIAPRIGAEADALIARLGKRDHAFDVHELAQHLPVTVVSDLVGLPEHGRSSMLRWASATFDALGPMNDRTRQAMPHLKELRAYCEDPQTLQALRPDGWAAAIWQSAERGEIAHDRCPVMMRDYISPSLDTTIMATASLIWLLGRNPDQWEVLRADPSLVPNAINEAVRLESPIRGFTRAVKQECQIDGQTLTPGDRVLVLYGSANRDERRWQEPEKFDIRRDVRDHLGFGFGVHVCVGMHLARLEMSALLESLLRQVSLVEVGEPIWQLNNVIHGIASLQVRLRLVSQA
jgi:cytochrome P450